MAFNPEHIVRKNIREMKPYSSARHEFTGDASVFLDANENSFGSPTSSAFNRYPDPLQHSLKAKLATIKGVPSENIFIGSGSDEAIDLLIRIFCDPGVHNIMIFPPTYGMYEVCAQVNNVAVKKVSLTEDFQLNMEAIERSIDANTRMIFICSPNNPTGNSILRSDIEIVLNNFEGVVVVDEAYINYSRQRTLIPELTEYPNLVILQTLSKAWGLAGLRIGMAFSSRVITDYLNKIKYPYNINTSSQSLALSALDKVQQVNDWIRITVDERNKLSGELSALKIVKKVYPSDGNFLLVSVVDSKKIYDYLAENGIIVRDRSNVTLCEGCLRITIGTPQENELLIEKLKSFQ